MATRKQRAPALAVHRGMLSAREMALWPYCMADHCVRPAMESLQLCLADSGERLLCRLYLCSFHADSVPLPDYVRRLGPGADPADHPAEGADHAGPGSGEEP